MCALIVLVDDLDHRSVFVQPVQNLEQRIDRAQFPVVDAARGELQRRLQPGHLHPRLIDPVRPVVGLQGLRDDLP